MTPPSDLDAVRAEGLKLAPWHLGVEIAPGLTTEDLYQETDTSEPFYDPGPAIKDWFNSLYPEGLEGRSAFDLACNNGAFLFALKEIGAGRCFGSDVRKLWIDQARYLVEHRQGPRDDMEFDVADLYDIPERSLEPFDVGIFAGIFYHLPDPIHGLRIAADLTKEVLFISTASRGDHPDGLLVAAEESPTQARSGVHGLSFFPTGPKVLTQILVWLGFPAVRCLNWRNPGGTASHLDSLQVIAARDARFLEGLDSRRPPGNAGMLQRIQETVPPRAPMLVARGKDGDSPDIPDREVWEFPEPADPSDPDFPAPDARQLIAQLEGFWSAGAQYLVIPSSAFEWLEENEEFKSFLDFRYTAAVRDPASCIMYDLRS